MKADNVPILSLPSSFIIPLHTVLGDVVTQIWTTPSDKC